MFANNADTNLPEIYVYRFGSLIPQQPGLPVAVRSNALYKISFIIPEVASVSNCSILSFSYTVHKLINVENVTGYETYFAKSLLNKEAFHLAEQLKLFKSHQPMRLVVNQQQEWRVKEIFERILEESTQTDLHRNEMMRTLIYQLILFSQRLAFADTDSV